MDSGVPFGFPLNKVPFGFPWGFPFFSGENTVPSRSTRPKGSLYFVLFGPQV